MADNNNEVHEAEFEETRPLALTERLSIQPVMKVEQARSHYLRMVAFMNSVMVPGVDYGVIPGTGDDKPSLLKPGAEKLIGFFGYRCELVLAEQVMEWKPEAPIFYFRYKANLYRDDRLIVSTEGSANSLEKKYRWRWVKEYELEPGVDLERLVSREVQDSIFCFQLEKRETSGQYGKPETYWAAWDKAIESGEAIETQKQSRRGDLYPAWETSAKLYRVPNPEPFDLINTLQKIAQKRALVSSALIGCFASSLFNQDLEDFDPGTFYGGSPSISTPEVHSPSGITGEEKGAEVSDQKGGKKSDREDFWAYYHTFAGKMSEAQMSVARAVGEEIIKEVEEDFDKAILLLGEYDESGELALRYEEKLDQDSEVDRWREVQITLSAMEYIKKHKLDLEDLVLRTARGTKDKPIRLGHVRAYERLKPLEPKADREDKKTAETAGKDGE